MTAKTKSVKELAEAAPSPFDSQTNWDEEDDPGYEETYYYYDDENNFIKLRQRDMAGTGHEKLKQYLMSVLSYLFRLGKCAVYGELNFYETGNPLEEPLYPDVALLKGQEWERLSSYRLGVTGPAPDLIIEIVSAKTRSSDLSRKPRRYAKWGTAEYFVYDPRPRQRGKNNQRLWGWRLNGVGTYDVITPEATGRLWSEQLTCWLSPDEQHVRLYDQEGNLVPTLEEAERREREAAERQAQLERVRREAAEQQTEMERRYKESAEQQTRLLQEQNQRLAEQIRKLGGNPDQLP